MTDLALIWNAEDYVADLNLVDGDLETHSGLRSAVIVSLFSNRRARPDDPLPQEGADRQGWWADSVGGEVDEIGSLLWLLSREKLTRNTLTRAQEYAEEALAWLVQDGVVKSVTVEVEVVGEWHLGFAIIVARGDGPARERFDLVWMRT